MFIFLQESEGSIENFSYKAFANASFHLHLYDNSMLFECVLGKGRGKGKKKRGRRDFAIYNKTLFVRKALWLVTLEFINLIQACVVDS